MKRIFDNNEMDIIGILNDHIQRYFELLRHLLTPNDFTVLIFLLLFSFYEAIVRALNW